MTDHAVAAEVARGAGRLLLKLRAQPLAATALRDQGDRSSHDYIVQALASLRPADQILSEEGKADQSRLAADRLWIVDPLDGTREFGEPGRVDWAVHVALVDGSGVPTAAAVALPAQGITFCTDPAPPMASGHQGPLRMVVSRSRPPEVATKVADALGVEVLAMGSAGAKAMAVVSGTVDIYLHAGGQYEWDSCAPVAVASAAGLHTSRIDGSPLAYNQPDPWCPDLLICRPELADPLLDALSG